MKIWLVRHGETDWNKLGRIQGSSQIPINDTGKSQAIEFAKKKIFSEHQVECVVHSGLLRSRQTAEIIVGGRKDVRVLEMKEFDELNYGSLEGKYFSECAEIKELWALGHTHVKCPDGESLQDVIDRMLKGIDRVHELSQGKDTLIVSHGTAIKALVCHFLKGYADVEKVTNCSVTIVERRKDSHWEIVQYNKN
jgi:uncharacterized phosphatase